MVSNSAAPSAYHVNSVDAKAKLVGDGPKQPPLGLRLPECGSPTPSCTGADAITTSTSPLYYQVLSARGGLAADEGPAF